MKYTLKLLSFEERVNIVENLKMNAFLFAAPLIDLSAKFLSVKHVMVTCGPRNIVCLITISLMFQNY